MSTTTTKKAVTIVTVASTSTLAIRLRGPLIEGKEPQTYVVNGTSHEGVVGGVAFTGGIPSDVLDFAMSEVAGLANVLSIVTPEQMKSHGDLQTSYGFEPGLKATLDQNTKVEAERPKTEQKPPAPARPAVPAAVPVAAATPVVQPDVVVKTPPAPPGTSSPPGTPSPPARSPV